MFTGQLVGRDTFSADLEFMAFYEFPASTLVVVSSPKQIEVEWRFVIAARRVIAGCQYKKGDELDYQPRYDQEAFELAESIASIDYQPDPVWVLDVCKTRGGAYHLLEIGGFSFADLYACNKHEVVAAVSATAKSVWHQTS